MRSINMNEEMSVKLDELLSSVEKFNNWFGKYETGVSKHCYGNLPDAPGIYLVVGSFCDSDDYFDFKEIYYIGVSTTSILQRWRNHHKMPVFETINLAAYRAKHGKEPDEYHLSFLAVHTWVNPFASSEYLLWLERKLIDKIQPPCNNLVVGRNRDSETVETTVIQLYSS